MPDIVGTPILEAPVAEGAKDQHMVLNMGPQHPSTHGVLRLVLEIDGEIVVRLYPEIGYLHTGIEKTCEAKFYQQVIPLTDRVDYLGPMANNLCYCLAVEKLLELEIPERAVWIRVLLTELEWERKPALLLPPRLELRPLQTRCLPPDVLYMLPVSLVRWCSCRPCICRLHQQAWRQQRREQRLWVTMSWSTMNCLSPASCARAPATGPPAGFLAFILSMHAAIGWPGA